MRDRLIELIKQSEQQEALDFLASDLDGQIDMSGGTKISCSLEYLIGFLLENGVICPPCKVGDTVYVVGEITRQIIPYEITAIVYAKEGLFMTSNILCFSVEHQFNKTVFLTKEEAEEHLQKGTN